MHELIWLGPFVVTFLGGLSYRFGLKWLAYRAGQLAEERRMDALEAALKAHKDQHAKAIANLVAEMRDELAQVKTRASIAIEKAGNGRRRFP